ncbi:MAG: SUMF1/EgtB/PvdO family nonheme iron enzyme, partial [Halobacteriovoraceae bacterium]|nr:SUMF1/EgtB/PvdO family nonheme iron enzyme [Halobacteriovoraceae bacterium]
MIFLVLFALQNLHGREIFNLQLIESAGKSFMMGSPAGEVNERIRSNEGKNGRPVEVFFTKNFEIMTTEVTQKLWFDIMDDNPSFFSKREYCEDNYKIEQTDHGKVELCLNHPVESVSWDMIQNFIKKLNENFEIPDCEGTPNDLNTGCF